MLPIVTVSGRASTRLRYSRSPGRRVPNRSNTGASKWRSWRLSFVAEVTNEDHATQERCDRIFLQWWILPPHSVHSANVAGGLRWHNIRVIRALTPYRNYHRGGTITVAGLSQGRYYHKGGFTTDAESTLAICRVVDSTVRISMIGAPDVSWTFDNDDKFALVADSTASEIQGGHSGLQMSPWFAFHVCGLTVWN